MSGIEEFFVHTIGVATKSGTGAMGDVFAPMVAVTGFLEGKTRLIRDPDGAQVVANTTFYCSVADSVRFTPNSQVLLPNGMTVYVITTGANDAAGLLGLPEHGQVYLT